MTPDDIIYELLTTGQITLEEYLKMQELPSVTIDRINKAIKEYETNRK
jgi:hypothetical protein